MNKEEFSKVVYDKLRNSGYPYESQAQAARCIDAVLESIQDVVATGEDVKFVNFGIFSSAERKAKKGRNIATGEPLVIDACTVPTFKAGTGFKNKVNGQ